MVATPLDTKTQLILTAGELFAEHGFDGVSTRMIADKAGVNLGGIHYHFGNKEALYIAAFRYVCHKEERFGLAHVFSISPGLMATPEGQAEAVCLACEEMLKTFFKADKPEWQMQLILRELSSPSSALPILAREIFKPNFEDNAAIYRKIKPEATDDEALIWNHMMMGQVMFYYMARPALKATRSDKPIDDDFLNTLVCHNAKAMILLAGLPLPKKLINA